MDMAYVNMGVDGRWPEIRAFKNVEYPLGIDLFFIDSDFRLLGLPRTTQLARQVNN
jgi:alpha-D-ribose 1-methylphosphonate 5-triphosphate synthase subunit PhnH